eukprot:GHVS01019480.1.p1 GENE.GHVS01019480.1~~GHVS01019480.1.p1  ORF type:complete len:225 (-),score=11.27 GHVS01019480.1:49-723(-)
MRTGQYFTHLTSKDLYDAQLTAAAQLLRFAWNRYNNPGFVSGPHTISDPFLDQLLSKFAALSQQEANPTTVSTRITSECLAAVQATSDGSDGRHSEEWQVSVRTNPKLKEDTTAEWADTVGGVAPVVNGAIDVVGSPAELKFEAVPETSIIWNGVCIGRYITADTSYASTCGVKRCLQRRTLLATDVIINQTESAACESEYRNMPPMSEFLSFVRTTYGITSVM